MLHSIDCVKEKLINIAGKPPDSFAFFLTWQKIMPDTAVIQPTYNLEGLSNITELDCSRCCWRWHSIASRFAEQGVRVL